MADVTLHIMLPIRLLQANTWHQFIYTLSGWSLLSFFPASSKHLCTYFVENNVSLSLSFLYFEQLFLVRSRVCVCMCACVCEGRQQLSLHTPVWKTGSIYQRALLNLLSLSLSLSVHSVTIGDSSFYRVNSRGPPRL